MSEIDVIDVRMHGLIGITAAYVVRGRDAALVETGPQNPASDVLSALEGAGIDELRFIVVTHIHLDHAGAAGLLAQRFPDSTVVVHDRGAAHLVDPSKLWASAARIYGGRMEELWGGIEPVPSDRVKAVGDGGSVDLGGRVLTAVETPGHARHHHAWIDDGADVAFVGDALGVRLPDVGVNRPATPPPEFDLEAAIASIGRIRGLGVASLWPTHYGPTDAGRNPVGPDEACDEAARALLQWAAWVRSAREQTRDPAEVVARVARESRAALEARLDETALERLEQTTSHEMNVMGYMRAFEMEDAGARSGPMR